MKCKVSFDGNEYVVLPGKYNNFDELCKGIKAKFKFLENNSFTLYDYTSKPERKVENKEDGNLKKIFGNKKNIKLLIKAHNLKSSMIVENKNIGDNSKPISKEINELSKSQIEKQNENLPSINWDLNENPQTVPIEDINSEINKKLTYNDKANDNNDNQIISKDSEIKKNESPNISKEENDILIKEPGNSFNKLNELLNKNYIEILKQLNSVLDLFKYNDDNSVEKINPNEIPIYTNAKCSNCQNDLDNEKYECSICDNIALCSECEKTHEYHPLIKFNLNNKNLTLSNKCALTKFIIYSLYQKQNKNNIGSSFKDLICKKKKNELPIYIHIKYNNINSFAIPLNQQYSFNVDFICNEKNTPQKEISIIFKSTINVDINSNPKEFSLEDKDSVKVEFTIPPIKEVSNFYIEINLNSKEEFIECKPLKLFVSVVEEENVSEENIKLLVKKYPELNSIPEQQKSELISLLNDEKEENTERLIQILDNNNIPL